MTETRTRTEPTTHTLEVPGAVLTYDIRRNDSSTAPVLLLIGSPMGASGFPTLAGHFTDRTVVTYDPRGVERSTKDDDTTESTPDEHADDLHRLISELDAGAVDIFGSSGGAVNGLALVAKHPEQVRTLVAHEPPTAQVLPDREAALAASRDVHETYLREGMGPGMAKFIAIVSHKGPIPADYVDQPAPDPAMFGLPTEDDGSRNDPLLAPEHRLDHPLPVRFRRPACGFDPHRHRRRSRIGGRAGLPCGTGGGRSARDEARHLPQRPRRLPRRRVRPDGRPRRLRGHPARGPHVLAIRPRRSPRPPP